MDFKNQLRNYQEFINKELEKKVRTHECLEYIKLDFVYELKTEVKNRKNSNN